MPPPTSWADLRGRRVGVWGLGVEGRASIRRLATLDVRPVVVDDSPPADLADAADVADVADGVLATDAGGLDALLACDVVIKTPGKSRYDDDVLALEDAGVQVVGGLGLWLAGADRERVLCVTGTKGKSTTTAIAAHLLARWGHPVVHGGNIGTPPFDPELDAPAGAWWVIEASSYQVTDFEVAPPVVAVTSLHPDHLTWHGDEATYERDKLALCTLPGARVVVANGDSDRLADQARAGRLGPNVRWVHEHDEPDAAWIDELGLLGAHNRRNALIARACLEELGVSEATDQAALAAAAAGFAHLPSRLTPVDTIDGVLFVDDSLSTNVLPTLAAVDAFPGRPVAVLVGGADRGIDYAPLATGLAARTAPTLVVVVESEVAARIRGAFAEEAIAVEVTAAVDEADGARVGLAWARSQGVGQGAGEGVVLLSPAAPSFDRYRDYRARSEAFVAGVARCRAAAR